MTITMQVNALQKGFLTLSDALLEELGKSPLFILILLLGPCSNPLSGLYFAESVKQERDALTTALHEIRHDTSRKMVEMQQRFDHVYALMQDYQVISRFKRSRQPSHERCILVCECICRTPI